MTQYDDTNRGALFPPRNKPNSTEPNTRVILTGTIDDNGQEKRWPLLWSRPKMVKTLSTSMKKSGRYTKTMIRKPTNIPIIRGHLKQTCFRLD